MNIQGYWKSVLNQDAETMRTYFQPHATIRWHNSNEQFTVEEFIVANCEYPGSWDGEIERIERINDLTITVTHVYSADHLMSFHVTSFIQITEDKINTVDEYWGDDGVAPKWRQDKQLGVKIK